MNNKKVEKDGIRIHVDEECATNYRYCTSRTKSCPIAKVFSKQFSTNDVSVGYDSAFVFGLRFTFPQLADYVLDADSKIGNPVSTVIFSPTSIESIG